MDLELSDAPVDAHDRKYLTALCPGVTTRLSDGFKNVVPSVLIFVTYTVSFVLFTATLPLWPLSIAYAIWSGAGTALTAVVGEFVSVPIPRAKFMH